MRHKCNRIKRIQAIGLSFALALSGVGITPSATVNSAVAACSTETEEEAPEQLSGQALVTLTLGSGEDSPLLREGYLDGDPLIRIRDVMCFGSAKELGKNQLRKVSLSRRTMYVVHVTSAAYSTDTLLKRMKGYSHVTEVSANYRMKKSSLTDDPMISEQWSLGGDHFYGKDGTTPVSASIGYQPETESDEKNIPVVAVVDDGIDFSHEDLAANRWVDPDTGACGYDAVNKDNDPTPKNINDYHGTLVAGIIGAATDNGIGIAGVAGQVRLMSVKMFDEDNEMSGSLAAQLACYEYICKKLAQGIRIVAVNCSFAMDPSPEPYSDLTENLSTLNAILTKMGTYGALTVFSAGNEATELTDRTYGANCELDDTYILRVGSVAPDGTLSKFSNYGANKIHLMAPGETILTTFTENIFLPETYDDQTRAKLCRLYETFDTAGSTGILAYSDIYPEGGSALAIAPSSEDIHGSKSSYSVELTLQRTRNFSPYAYTFFYDVTDYNLNPRKKIYYSLMLREDTDATGSWDHYSETLRNTDTFNLYSSGERTYLGINLKKLLPDTTMHIGNRFYIDDLALSVEDPDENAFGKYEYVSGTSFSSPMVCGAIARLARMFPEDNSLTRKEKLLSSVHKSDSLKGKCSSEGFLDVSAYSETADIHVDPIIYKVKKVTLNQTKATLKVGKKLKLKATITPDYATDSTVNWKVSKKAYASVTKNGVVKAKKKGRGHTVTVTATARDGSKKKATCKIRIK